MKITLHLDKLMLEKKISLTDLAERIGITLANLSILKNSKAKAVRFSTLAALCRELDCQPGDLLEYVSEHEDAHKNQNSLLPSVNKIDPKKASGPHPIKT